MQAQNTELQSSSSDPVYVPAVSWISPEAKKFRPSIAVVIPALEEGHTISNVISKLSLASPWADIIVVDGGSSDGTVEKAKGAMAKVVYESRRGYGRAIRSGIRSVDADLYAIVDADDTYDLSHFSKMLELAGKGGKLVIGRRDGISTGGMSLSHRIGNHVLSLLCSFLFRIKVSDSQSGLKVFPGRIAKALREDGMSLSSEILVKSRLMGYDVEEVPVIYQARNGNSKSKFSFWQDGVSVLLYLIFSRMKKEAANSLIQDFGKSA